MTSHTLVLHHTFFYGAKFLMKILVLVIIIPPSQENNCKLNSTIPQNILLVKIFDENDREIYHKESNFCSQCTFIINHCYNMCSISLTARDGLFPFLSGCFRASTLGLNPLGMKLSHDILSTTATWRMLKTSIRLSVEDSREGS